MAKKAGTPKNPAEVTLEIYGLLSRLDAAERSKALGAVITLLGDTGTLPLQAEAPKAGQQSKDLIRSSRSISDASAFFNEKDPHSKVEELAVAARFRELSEDLDVHTKDDLRQVIKSARRNFDDNNFTRDIGNAKTAGLFNKGTEMTLSFYGQNYVDALPDRAAVKALRKPKGTNRRVSTKSVKGKKRRAKPAV